MPGLTWKAWIADSFIHRRLGKLVLKRLSDHAYGTTRCLDAELKAALTAMVVRLKNVGPRLVTAEHHKQWYIYTDASFETETLQGGLGGVLIDECGDVCSWFGIGLDAEACKKLGVGNKGTIVYELELLELQ